MMSQKTYLIVLGCWFAAGCLWALVMNLLYLKAFLATRETFRRTGRDLTWVGFLYSGKTRRSIRDVAPEQATRLKKLLIVFCFVGPAWLAGCVAIVLAGSQ
jgi:hypothetical protein